MALYSPSTNNNPQNPNFIHNATANVYFLDGHAEARNKMQIPCYEGYPTVSQASRTNTYFCLGGNLIAGHENDTIPGL